MPLQPLLEEAGLVDRQYAARVAQLLDHLLGEIATGRLLEPAGSGMAVV
ncbi:MAG: hypothetical protein IT307_20520 [Chloroflexi bacterium]|nr:hypothetical protein [Chloroflexota bacterium]